VSQFDIFGNFKNLTQDTPWQLSALFYLPCLIFLSLPSDNEGDAACGGFIININIRNVVINALNIG
jgi:hypothetical protein